MQALRHGAGAAMSRGPRWQIEYIDFNGRVTRRTIVIQSVSSDGRIQAWCELRREERTFKVSNIRQAIDADTGEVLDPMSAIGLSRVKAMPARGASYGAGQAFARGLMIVIRWFGKR